MQIVPVIDLMGGVVVRGVGGRRHEYRPIESRLATDARPASIAHAFRDLGYRALYLADLDAIQERDANHFSPPAWDVYAQLLALGCELWIDAGIRDTARARELAEFTAGGRTIAGIVAGLESLESPRLLAELCRAVGPRRLIFSLDLKHGEPLIGGPAWQGLHAGQIAALALRLGVRRMIVLDLARVGMGAGVGTEPVCRALRCLDAQLQIVAGGGVRGAGDLESLNRAGCDAALVASALHDGRIGGKAAGSGQKERPRGRRAMAPDVPPAVRPTTSSD